MQFSPGFLGSFLTGAGNWNITLDDHALVIQSKSRQSRIEYPSVTSIAVHPGLIWSRVKIYTSGHSFQISGITNNGGRLLKRALEGRIADSLANLLNDNGQAIRMLAGSLEEFLSCPKYLANHDILNWFARLEWRLDQSIKTTLDALRSEYLPINILDGELGQRVEQLRDVMTDRANFFKRRNREFVDREIAIHGTYFDSVETSPLTLFDKLANELTQRGIKLKPRSQEELLRTLNQPKINLELSSLLRAFIKHAKSNELVPSALASTATTMPHPYRAKLFAAIAAKVMGAYEKKLRASGDLDFEDLIIDAAKHASSDDFTHPYKLILVDEFQDISRARAKLLLSLLNRVPDCQLFAVGDDWQSIYRFAGSDIAILTGFESTFGYTAINYLTQTFRSNQGIADLAATFVQRNPSQMKKSVKASDNTTDNVIAIRKYARMQEMERLIEEALFEIAARNESGKVATVLILGRYRHQSPDKLAEWRMQFADALIIEFRTIHSSKGLQADYVILIGLHSGKNAFPSDIADDPLLQMVMPTPETFQHSEERRLFYVALTRARHRVYLLGGKYTPSAFLVELDKVAWVE